MYVLEQCVGQCQLLLPGMFKLYMYESYSCRGYFINLHIILVISVADQSPVKDSGTWTVLLAR